MVQMASLWVTEEEVNLTLPSKLPSSKPNSGPVQVSLQSVKKLILAFLHNNGFLIGW